MKDIVDEIVNNLTEPQNKLFNETIFLWKRISELNGRPQNFDSFDVDKNMLIQEWNLLHDKICSVAFD